jgi:hypothetical protein
VNDWIKWDGGASPIKSDKTRLEIKLRYGTQLKAIACALRWSDTGTEFDITAYRIIKDHEPKERTILAAIPKGGDA